MSIKSVLPYLQAVQTIVTVGAIIVGAIWSRRTIFKKREEAPKVRLTHEAFCHNIDRTGKFIRVKLRIENQGNVLIRLDEVDTWLYQVKPWPDDILDESKMLDVDSGSYNWPGVPGITNRNIKPSHVEIEPNEYEDFHFDFVVARVVEVIVIYSYVNNPTKRIGIGWNLSTIHDTSRMEDKGERQAVVAKARRQIRRRSGAKARHAKASPG